VEWNNGSNSWVVLKDLKDTNPVQIAEYAVVNNLTSNEPAFQWWVPFVLKKVRAHSTQSQDKVLVYASQVQTGAIKKHDRSIAVLQIDRRTETDFWRKAMDKEIRNVLPAFEFIEGDNAKVPPGYYTFVDKYFVFDTKRTLHQRPDWWQEAA
jgi:hypothetical protein